MTRFYGTLLFVLFVAFPGLCTNQPASFDVWQWPFLRWTLSAGVPSRSEPAELLALFGRRTDSDTKPISSDVPEAGRDKVAAEKHRYWNRFKRQYTEANVSETPTSTSTTTSTNKQKTKKIHSTAENAQRRPSRWIPLWQRKTLNTTPTPNLNTQTTPTTSTTTTTTTSTTTTTPTTTTTFMFSTQMTSTLPSRDTIASSVDHIEPGPYDEENAKFDKFVSCLAACHAAVEKYAVKTVERKSALSLENAREFVNCNTNCLIKFERRRHHGGSQNSDDWLSDLYDYLARSTSIWILAFVVVAGVACWQSDALRVMRNWFGNSNLNVNVDGSSEYTPIWSDYSNSAGGNRESGDVNRAVNRAWTIVRYQAQRTIYYIGQLTVYILSLSYIPDNIAQYVPWSDAAARVETMGMQAFRGTVDDETRSALSDDDGTVGPSPDQDAAYCLISQQSAGTNPSPNGEPRQNIPPARRTDSKTIFLPKQPSRGAYDRVGSNEMEMSASNRQPYVALYERERLSGIVNDE